MPVTLYRYWCYPELPSLFFSRLLPLTLLGVTQQAVAQAERWAANPTVALVERWAEACGGRMVLRIEAMAS